MLSQLLDQTDIEGARHPVGLRRDVRPEPALGPQAAADRWGAGEVFPWHRHQAALASCFATSSITWKKAGGSVSKPPKGRGNSRRNRPYDEQEGGANIPSGVATASTACQRAGRRAPARAVVIRALFRHD